MFAPKSEASRAHIAAALMNFSRAQQSALASPAGSNDNFALVNGGTFQMGSPASEPERSSDEIQHSVTVGSFYMAKTEVTQQEYQAVMGNNPSETKGDNLPVTNITWYDAIQYCNKLSEAEGLTPCYTIAGTTVTWDKSANGYRLPTEAEWEYAARANTTTPFSFGDYVHNSDANCYNAYGYNNDASGNWVNGSDAYLRRTVAVDQYAANAYGLYNMHGNAAEWVWDWYSTYDSQASTNPTGPESGNAKVVAGRRLERPSQAHPLRLSRRTPCGCFSLQHWRSSGAERRGRRRTNHEHIQREGRGNHRQNADCLFLADREHRRFSQSHS